MDIAKERICELEDEYEEIRQAAVQTKRWKIWEVKRIYSEKFQLMFSWISRRQCYRECQRGNIETVGENFHCQSTSGLFLSFLEASATV